MIKEKIIEIEIDNRKKKNYGNVPSTSTKNN